jgi:flagellar hook assembly protein FlgD
VSAVGKQPAVFALGYNAPNPFNSRTTLRFSIPEAGMVRMVIYDVHGRFVRTLLDEHRAAGMYRISWDGRDGTGRAVGSGAYVCQLRSGDRVATLRITLLR